MRAEFVVWGTRKVSILCLLYNIYHRADHPLYAYLHRFLAACNTRGSAALCELALVILRRRLDQFSRPFLPAVLRTRKLLFSGVLSGDTVSSFKSAVNLCLLRD